MAKGIQLASAYIDLHVNSDRIPDEIRRALMGAERQTKIAGRKQGSVYGRSFGGAVAQETKKAVRATQRDAGKLDKTVIQINDRIEASNDRTRASYLALNEARKKGVSGSAMANKEKSYNAALREQRKLLREIDDLTDSQKAMTRKVNVDLDVDTAGATAKVSLWKRLMERDDVEVKVRADMHGSHKQAGLLANNLERVRRADLTKIGVTGAAISGLPALATGIAEVTAALVQLSQAALAVPGALAGVASSFGTLAFGVTGITDAYDALSKANDEAKSSGGAVAQQARAQMSASFSLRNAIKDEEDARKDVNRAIRDTKRDLQDLNLQMRGGVVDEKRAVHELNKARQRLYSGDYTDYVDAVLDVEEAEIRVAESRTRNSRTHEELSEAAVKGVANSDQVVAANERLIRSQQGVAQAQAGVAAASEGTSAQTDAADAMGKLSDNAQEFVRALVDLQGPVMELRNLVQDNIFEGMAAQLEGFAKKAMPTFERGLGGIGKAWNNTFTEMFDVLGKGENLSILDRIFGNTEDAQNILNDAIDPLVEGLLTLTGAGTDALPRIAEGLVDVAERFADFITQADKDGRLAEWIDEGITALANLGEIALNVGKMITGISDATDGNFLQWLADATSRWEGWINSAKGQDTLNDIFDEGKAIFEKWRPILEDLPGVFMGLYNGSKAAMDLILPMLNGLTSVIDKWPGLLETAIKAFTLLTAAKMINSIRNLTGALAGIGTTIAGVSTQVGTPGKGGTGLLGKLSLLTASALILNDIFNVERSDFDPEKSSWGHILLGPGFDKLFGPRDNSFLPGNAGAPGVPAFGPRVQGPGVTQPGGSSIAPFTTMPGSNPLNALGGGSGRTGSEYGLQTHTRGVKRAIEQHFPQIDTIGGYRQFDQFTWHPHGKAIDVMIPGGTTRNGANPQGKALGDQIWAWLQVNGPSMGVDVGASLWQTDQGGDHFDHIHVATTGGGYPAGAAIPANGDTSAGRSAPAAPSPKPPPAPSASAPAGGPKSWPFSSPPPAYLQPPAAPSTPAPVQGPMPAGQPARTPSLEELLGIKSFDTGGWWQDGQIGINNTGKDELVLNPDDIKHLSDNGIDPNSLQHGASAGAAPGPAGPGAGNQPVDPAQRAEDLGRTEGYIPLGAGNINPVGEGGLSNFLDLGESFVHGLIDTGADLASMAATAAIASGSMGAGAAAGPAASMGIKMGAEAAKRGVSYLYDLGGIWGEAAIEQLFPFGAPHWLGTSPMAFMPQQIPGLQPGQGQLPMPGAGPEGWQPGPGVTDVPDPMNPLAHTPGGPPGPGGAPAPPPPQNTPSPGFNPSDPMSWLNLPSAGTFDQGGVLPAQSIGANLSKQPEYVFTGKQMANMEKVAAVSTSGRNETNNFYSQDLDGMFREYEKKRRRESRTHSGRP